MLGRTKNQRYLLWLALGTATMALAMASLLVFELAQKRAIDQSSAIRSDSLTALAFQFEREFLRTRQSIAETLSQSEGADQDALALRYDIFLSRMTLLRESPSVSLLTAREEYRKVMARLEPLVLEMDQGIASSPVNRKVLAHVLAELNAMGADVQALTFAANSEVAHLLEHQADTMGQQNQLIVALTVAQLVLLVIAAASLAVRQRRLEAERLALEQLTDELRDAQFRAEAANRGKSQFLANMSHELRTPFNGLMGMLGLLQGTPVSKQQGEYIQTAQESASHLLTLLNDILDLSAMETGKMTIKPAPVQLPRLLAEVNALMQPLAKSKGLVFYLRLADTPLPTVLADTTRLKQILFNLISNAIKFTESGQVSLTMAPPVVSAETVEIVFAVQDTGIGIEPKVLSRLFQRFYQAEGSATRKFGGTGLGLEISQSIARLMDGEITVVSVPGEGSTFTLTLRLPIVAELVAPVPAVVVQDVPPSQAKDTQGLRILVVEDHPINRKLVGVLLGRMGCQVAYSEDGQQAVERVQQEPFDLILMDVNMPVMDGLSATRYIRSLPGVVAQTPIVVVTADVMNEAREQSKAAGANDFISKPLNVDHLRAVILEQTANRVVRGVI